MESQKRISMLDVQELIRKRVQLVKERITRIQISIEDKDAEIVVLKYAI